MKINELHKSLRSDFSNEKGFGITKINKEEWKNIYFVVPPPPPREIRGPLPTRHLSEALKVLGKLPQFSEMSKLDKMINYLFIGREVVQSSRMEGTWSTIDHVLTPGDIYDKSEEKSEHLAVRSYATVIEDIINQTLREKEKVFTKDFICNIQKRIVENDPHSKGVPGKLRTEGEPGAIVTIGGGIRKENSIYNPAPASEVRRCLDIFLKWLRDDELAQLGDAAAGGLSLPVRMAIGHAHFEAIHPFTDGNGRAGRALWPAQMVCSQNMPLYLSGYVEEYKGDYIKALEEAQKRLNHIPLIEFICDAIIESNLENKKTKQAIKELEKKWQERGGFRAKSAPRRAFELLLSSPIVTSSFLQKELNISKTASIDAINALKRKKIIRSRKTENRKRIFAAEELIQILSRPFGSEVELALEKAETLLGL